MFDPINLSLLAISREQPAAFGFVFLAGLVTSIGPCAAPRLVAISGLGAHSRRGLFGSSLAFVAGLITAYASFGIFASLLGQVTALSQIIYVLVAIGLACGALITLIQQPHAHSDELKKPYGASAGAAFLLGASFTFVISPCCTPVLIGILAYCAQTHNVGFSVALLSAFALGHATPVIALASGVARISEAVRRFNADEAFRVVSGALMLALSGYFLCLA
jgi:cytochrome c biogenesis protein CcdA